MAAHPRTRTRAHKHAALTSFNIRIHKFISFSLIILHHYLLNYVHRVKSVLYFFSIQGGEERKKSVKKRKKIPAISAVSWTVSSKLPEPTATHRWLSSTLPPPFSSVLISVLSPAREKRDRERVWHEAWTSRETAATEAEVLTAHRVP